MPSDILINVATSVIASVLFGAAGAYIGFVRLQERVKTLETKVKELGEDGKKINDKVVECCIRIDERGGKGLTRSKSPVSLTERGYDLLQKSGGQAWISQYRDELIKAIKDKNPLSAYDVQEYAQEVLKGLVTLNDPRLKPLKDYAYAQGIELDDIILVMGIHLRDETMPSFPTYKVSDIPDPMPSSSPKMI
jgi:hypothetical protein